MLVGVVGDVEDALARVGGLLDAVGMTASLLPMPGPTRDRVELPDGYGLPDDDTGILDWAEVEPRLVAAQHYWLGSVRPDGRPHAIPRWGVWLDGRFWYDGSPETRHARNAEQNPAVTLTLEDGKQAVIVEGKSRATRADAGGLGARLATAFEKYHADGYAPGADAWSAPDGGGLRVITPVRALAWFSFPTDATRFRW